MQDSSYTAITSNIQVSVTPLFLEKESRPIEKKQVFAYYVTIINHSNEPVKILARHWEIEDSDGNILIVDGEGIVGAQPTIDPNQEYEYNSFSILKGYRGSMTGYYIGETGEGKNIKIQIPKFLLVSYLLN